MIISALSLLFVLPLSLHTRVHNDQHHQQIIIHTFKERQEFELVGKDDDYDNDETINHDEITPSSRWKCRTARRRQRTEDLLHDISNISEGLPIPSLTNVPSDTSESNIFAITPTLRIPLASLIDWNAVHLDLDPLHGGKINREINHIKRNIRGLRKREQIQAFHFILSSLLNAYSSSKSTLTSKIERFGVTIIDAGCGAGNLAIALAGLLDVPPYNNNSNSNITLNIHILAIDVNEVALKRLSERWDRFSTTTKNFISITTCCSDLANYEYIVSHIPPQHDVIVASLHACGAASDMAMNLAYQCDNAPFVICPCCTGKSLTRRNIQTNIYNVSLDYAIEGTTKKTQSHPMQTENSIPMQSRIIHPWASHYRSGATSKITYPRSLWLKSKIANIPSNPRNPGYGEEEEVYTLLAKVADIGLGPQTFIQQREQQRRAKRIIELDRLESASERQGGNYDTRLMRIVEVDDNPTENDDVDDVSQAVLGYSYGKGELLLGALRNSLAANVLMQLPSS